MPEKIKIYKDRKTNTVKAIRVFDSIKDIPITPRIPVKVQGGIDSRLKKLFLDGVIKNPKYLGYAVDRKTKKIYYYDKIRNKKQYNVDSFGYIRERKKLTTGYSVTFNMVIDVTTKYGLKSYDRQVTLNLRPDQVNFPTFPYVIDYAPHNKSDGSLRDVWEIGLKAIKEIINEYQPGYVQTITFTGATKTLINLTRQQKQDLLGRFQGYTLNNEMISSWTDSGKGFCGYEMLSKRYGDKIPFVNHRSMVSKFFQNIYNTQTPCEYCGDCDFTNNICLGCSESRPRYSSSLGVSPRMFLGFCKKYNISMYAMDADEEFFLKYTPEKVCHKYPAFAFILSNAHYYLVEDQHYIAGLRNKTRATSYQSKQKKKEFVLKENDKIVSQDKVFHNFLKYLEKGNVGKIKRNHGKMTKLVLKDKTFYANDELKEVLSLLDQLKAQGFNIPFENQSTISLSCDLFSQLYPNHQKSMMNQDVYDQLTSHSGKKGPFCFTFDTPNNDYSFRAYDINKCYTNSLLNPFFEWNVLDALCQIEQYDNKGFSRAGYYYVKTNNYFPMKIDGWYSNGFLKWAKKEKINFEIKYQIICEKTLPKSYFKNFGDVITKLSDFKLLSNGLIGMFGKDHSNKSTSKLTTDLNQATLAFWSDNPTFTGEKKTDSNVFIRTHKTKTKKIYEIETIKEALWLENNVPIYINIIENSYIQIYNLWKKTQGRLLRIETDCVIVDGGNRVPLSSDIGGYKDITEEKFDLKFRVSDKPKPNPEPTLIIKDWNHQYETDFEDFDDMATKMMDKNQGFMCDGLAGTGKSTFIMKLNKECETRNLKYVNLTPTNASARKIKGDTLHYFMGLDRSGNLSGKKMTKLSNYDYIFVDEKSMIGSKLLGFMSLAKRLNPDLKVCFFGDWTQLEPVGEEHRDFESCQLYKTLCDFNHLSLTITKRYELPLQKLRDECYKQGRLVELLPSEDCDINLCYFVSTTKIVNHRVMERRAKANKKFVCVPAIVGDARTQDLKLHKNTPVYARINDRNMNVYNNEKYLVHSWNKSEITLKNEVHSFISKIDDFQKTFLVAYATTVHKSQGQTIDKPYTLYDVKYYSKKMLNTALTRATKKSLINVREISRSDVYDYNNMFLKNKINSYKDQDEKGNRSLTNFINVREMREKIILGNNECKYCSETLDERNFTLDRLDNTLCHSNSNTVLACYTCNCNRRFDEKN